MKLGSMHCFLMIVGSTMFLWGCMDNAVYSSSQTYEIRPVDNCHAHNDDQSGDFEYFCMCDEAGTDAQDELWAVIQEWEDSSSGRVPYKHLNLFAPFPTKTLLTFNRLKNLGMMHSEIAQLTAFYLQEGPFTEITSLVRSIADSIPDGQTTLETVFAIINWEHDAECTDQDVYNEYKGTRNMRSAHDILTTGCFTGCKDFGVVFTALARAKGLATTSTETVYEDWIYEMVQNNKWSGPMTGHFFCEVYFPDIGRWIVVDPTNKRIASRTIKGYYIMGQKKFLLLERGLDAADFMIPDQESFIQKIKNRFYIEGNRP